ncbi:flippase-like domain-containing protein [Frankia sp. CNm7]|uniref:Flippase-like domain-containing protein n=2 Tax=Frankia nepalensis TaxID=1836974 RepID=A0A937UVM8_9ACTN|nr:lysylphosphatidylglycerol synthase domain-containing protein [Frankia nepalensis]MBL7497488.1 flippase-like domain-containing protein [Frankia nepalensis]MBL7509571.1 flippase-like domain-containing protein [Frankia nepalensis]MBL7517745.1 flippase-like domain-containing protein [Frankia nepalensis]MBL7633390.1 flippase-like domain-containing protein [Frankia nepalensis]
MTAMAAPTTAMAAPTTAMAAPTTAMLVPTTAMAEEASQALEAEPESAPPVAKSRWSKRVMTALSIVMPAFGAVWLATHHDELGAAFEACRRAEGKWLLVAALAACATYVAAAASMKGSVAHKLPFGQLVAVQIAGILPNTLAPAGMGVAAVQMRYLLRRGLSMAEAVASTAVNATAGAIPHGIMLVVLLLAGAVPLPRLALGPMHRYLLIALPVAVAVVVCVPRLRQLARTLARRLVEQRGLLVGAGSTRRAALLWGGSIAIPMLHAATLCAVAAALHAPLGPGKIMVVYLVASALAAVIPSPGGFGGLDAALTALLTTAGAPTTTAIAAVLGYRLLTNWLPLAPSAAVCGVLIRARVL